MACRAWVYSVSSSLATGPIVVSQDPWTLHDFLAHCLLDCHVDQASSKVVQERHPSRAVRVIVADGLVGANCSLDSHTLAPDLQ